MNRSLLALLPLVVAAHAHAFSVGSVAGPGCHERITLDALGEAGVVADRASVTADDRALLAALPVRLPGAWDRRTLALVVGLRDNDFHGVSEEDLGALVRVHVSPTLQHEHCLRAPGEDRGAGDVAALARCRAFIEEELRRSVTAAPGATERVLVSVRGQVAPFELPAAEVHLGRALHALQDGFSHTLRDRGFSRVRAVFNYVDPLVGGDFSAERDGHAHVTEFDECDVGPARARAAAATEATRAVLAALHDDATAEAKLEAVAEVLDATWGYEPACVGGAAWCTEAEELLLDTRPIVSFSGLRGAMFNLAVGAMAPAPATAAATGSAGGAAPEKTFRLRPVFGLGISTELGAGVVDLGLRLPLPGRFELFADAELSPRVEAAGRLNAGSLHALVGSSVRWGSIGDVKLRSSAGAGAGVLLERTETADAGAVAPLLRVSAVDVLVPGPGTTRVEVRPDLLASFPRSSRETVASLQYRVVVALRLE